MKTLQSLLAASTLLTLAHVALAKAPPELRGQLALKADTFIAKSTAATKVGKAERTELQFQSQDGTLVATLFTPQGVKNAPLVIALHGEGPGSKPGDFFDEAAHYANQGLASLVLHLPFGDLARAPLVSSRFDAQQLTAAVRQAKLALDWAVAKPGINGKKVALVGQRYGAWVATLLAAIDERIDAVALVAPPGKPSGWLQVSDRPSSVLLREAMTKVGGSAWAEYLFSLQPLDPEAWIKYAKPAKLFFQFASQDEWTTTLEQVDLYRAAAEPKSRMSYEGDSKLDSEARSERMAWVVKALKN